MNGATVWAIEIITRHVRSEAILDRDAIIASVRAELRAAELDVNTIRKACDDAAAIFNLVLAVRERR